MASNGAIDGAHASSTADDGDWDPYRAATAAGQQSSAPPSSGSPPLYLGIDLATATTAATVTPLISAALAAPFDYALAPISYTVELPSDASAPTVSPLAFPSATFNTNILALVAHSITDILCTATPSSNSSLTSASSSPSSASLSLHTAAHHFQECFDYYSHLSLCTVFVAPPADVDPSAARQLARCLLPALQSHAEVSVVVQLVCDAAGYDFYIRLLTACGHHRRIFLSLVLTAQLPSPALLRLIRAEQLHSITLDSGCWVTNHHGYPILPPKHKAAVLDSLSYCQAVILRPDLTHHTNTAADTVGSVAFHQHYIHYLHTLHTGIIAAAGAGGGSSLPAMYRDYLQSPLQPLHDNLSNQTYEVFESDPIKYSYYSQAIQAALTDLNTTLPTTTTTTDTASVVVWVVGAGRGPLVWAVLKAAEASGVRVQLVAFEKNKHALQTLYALYSTQWQPYQHLLTIQPHNILHFTPLSPTTTTTTTPLPHLLVSELLGSFGDNELSVECLDAACRWLRPGGICIPERSVSYLVPVRNARVMGQLAAGSGGGEGGREMAYVVQLHACERVVEEEGRVCFVFAHPSQSAVDGSEQQREEERRSVEAEEDGSEERRVRRVRGDATVADDAAESTLLNAVRTAPPPAHHPITVSSPLVSFNNRYRTLRYTASATTAITGLAGYFTARLYRNITLSTYPPTHTPALTSWFPLYFPLQAAVTVRCGDGVEVGVWRCVEEKRVWYEWCVDVVGGSSGDGGGAWFGGSMIHNAGGKSASIGL